MKLPLDFYLNPDVVQVAKQLIGKILISTHGNKYTSGKIVETEAYAGISDKASHAFGGKYTNRTKVMYEQGGVCYIYLCYGIHHLFNVVTNIEGVPHAVLIRAIEPLEGIDIMLKRRGLYHHSNRISNGPALVSQSLGFHSAMSGSSLISESPIWIEDANIHIPATDIVASPRIGVDYAGDDALLPYRFMLNSSKWVSKRK